MAIPLPAMRAVQSCRDSSASYFEVEASVPVTRMLFDESTATATREPAPGALESPCATPRGASVARLTFTVSSLKVLGFEGIAAGNCAMPVNTGCPSGPIAMPPMVSVCVPVTDGLISVTTGAHTPDAEQVVTK